MGIETKDRGTVACLARAIATELRRKYPHHATKYVAQDLGCGVKLAESLLGGHLSSTSVAMVIAAYGPGWVAERVLEAAGLTLDAYIDNQVAEAERAAIRARERAKEARSRLAKIQAARGGRPGNAGARP